MNNKANEPQGPCWSYDETVRLVGIADTIHVRTWSPHPGLVMLVSTTNSAYKIPDEHFKDILKHVETNPALKAKLEKEPIHVGPRSGNIKPSLKEPKEVVNKKPCAECIQFTSGISFGYEWKDCKKNWSDKKNGMFYGVIKDTCDNHHVKKEEA